MANADALQFRITAKDETSAAFKRVEAMADRMQASASRGAGGARQRIEAQVDRAASGFERMGKPIGAISPQLGRVHAGLMKIGKASPAMRSLFTSSIRAGTKSAHDQAVQLNKLRSDAMKGASRAANLAADRAAGKHGLGRFTGTDAIKAVGERFFGAEREAAGPAGLARAQRAEGAAYEGAHASHMADAEREISDVAKGFGEAGVAAEGAEAGIMGLVGSVGGLALAAVGAVVAIDALAMKSAAAYGREGRGVDNASLMTGMDPATLQRWRGAAERVGVDPHQVDSALGGLGLKLHNLSYGMGDAGTANMLAQMGIAVPKPGETPDVDAIGKQIADKLQAIKDPYTKGNTARALGLDGLLPLLNQGSAGVSTRQAGFDRTGAAFTRPDLDKADAQAERSANFEQSKRGVGKRLGSLATDATGFQVDAAASAMQMADPARLGDVFKGAGVAVHGLGDAASATAYALKSIVAPAAHAAELHTPPTRRTPGAQRMTRDVALSVERATSPATPASPKTPTARRHWPLLTPAVNSAIEKAAAFYKLDPEMMRAVAYRESSFNPTIKAADVFDKKKNRWIRNSATGLYQFTNATWLETVKKHGKDAGMGDVADEIYKDQHGEWQVKGGAGERDRVLGLRKDAQLNAMMGGALTVDNAERFRRYMGRAPDVGEMYGSHMLGIAGEEKLARARETTPNASAAALLPQAAEHNQPVFYGGGGTPLTVEALGEFLQRIGAGQAGSPSPPPPAINVKVDVHMDRDGGVKHVVQKIVSTR